MERSRERGERKQQTNNKKRRGAATEDQTKATPTPAPTLFGLVLKLHIYISDIYRKDTVLKRLDHI